MPYEFSQRVKQVAAYHILNLKASFIDSYFNIGQIVPGFAQLPAGVEVSPNMRGMVVLSIGLLVMSTVLSISVSSQSAFEEDRKICSQYSMGIYMSREYFLDTFGIIQNFTKFQTFDVRQTNLLKDIMRLNWEGVIPGGFHKMVFDFIRHDLDLDEYIYDVHNGTGINREWNEETSSYDLPTLKKGKKGTLEEMIRFTANMYEYVLAGLDEEDMEEIEKERETLAMISKEKNLTDSSRKFQIFVDQKIEGILNPDYHDTFGNWYYSAVAYQDLTGEAGDWLRDHLKIEVFFQKTEDNRLPGS